MPDTLLDISDLSGGRNGIDGPTAKNFPFNQCVEAVNVDFRNGGIGRKRGGTFDVNSNTNVTGVFTFQTASLHRHTPGGDETQAEMWGLEQGIPGATARLPSASAVWTVIAGSYVPTSTAEQYLHQLVSFNGKAYEFFQDTTADNRLKVYDPVINAQRKVGIKDPGVAPVIANQGAGAYPAVQRWYRVRWFTNAFGRLSEPSPSTAFTPSGANAAARVFRPAIPNEGETGWLVEYSPDNVNFYRAAFLGIATLTYDDTVLVANESNFPLSEILGTFTLVPSARYGCTDGNRLIIANLPQVGLGSRVLWTPVLGSLDEGDDERIFQTATIKPYIDLDTKNGGDITGLAQINGVIYVFKWRQIWRLTPTDDFIKPYSARRISGTVGAVSQKSIALGEDANGNPCLYFMSHKGPYRVGPVRGIEYIGRDIEDLTRTSSATPNINTTATVVAHGVFHPDLFQYWVWWSSGSQSFPDKCAALDIKKATRQDEYGVRNGWSQITGPLATATCSSMGPHVTLANSGAMRPWVGLAASGTPGDVRIGIADRDDVFSDRGTAFQAYVKTRSVKEFGKYFRTQESTMIAKHHTAALDVTLRLTIDRDLGQDTTSTDDITLLAAEIDQLIIRKFEGSAQADAKSLQFQIGDASAIANAWELRQLIVPVFQEGDI